MAASIPCCTNSAGSSPSLKPWGYSATSPVVSRGGGGGGGGGSLTQYYKITEVELRTWNNCSNLASRSTILQGLSKVYFTIDHNVGAWAGHLYLVVCLQGISIVKKLLYRIPVADLRFDKGGFKSKIRMRAHFLQGSPAHFLIEEPLEVNEIQIV